jgi:LAS superfamily LD-carboxypeptidase LdcB
MKNIVRTLSAFPLVLTLLLVGCESPKKVEKVEDFFVKDSSGQSNKVDTFSEKIEKTDNVELPIDPNLSPKDREKVLDIINKKYLMGQFNPAADPRFSSIPTKYLVNNAQVIYMRNEALEKFVEMQAAAQKDGISLKIMSATRPFDVQKAIWERKWQGKQQVNGYYIPDSLKGKDRALRILEWNSMPSTSRHHWGTDIDINNVNPEYWTKNPGKKQYEWLTAHAHEYGFCQPYSEMGKNRPVGYQEEKWHWSYLPLSREFVKKYKEQIKNSDIGGFMGSETALEIGVVEIYVLGINPDCK